ncbi:LLM class flavin-dependent oxidoreductase [Streptomyces sp. WI04-05B]|uniref:LLM class flavin-dependent oxidoreductase n=1 Tax=Streptomyces echiniscabiei TaxID=3028708 RepID=UPI0029B60FC0|nr:LLM class flavin-dependent oxidoreductase [Streptomyces sp. WI04-05A]
MSTPSISSLAFLTPGNFADDDPYTGLEETLQLFEYGERLGFDGAWIRQRHLEHGVGSAAVFLAAAGQRTERVIWPWPMSCPGAGSRSVSAPACRTPTSSATWCTTGTGAPSTCRTAGSSASSAICAATTSAARTR